MIIPPRSGSTRPCGRCAASRARSTSRASLALRRRSCQRIVGRVLARADQSADDETFGREAAGELDHVVLHQVRQPGADRLLRRLAQPNDSTASGRLPVRSTSDLVGSSAKQCSRRRERLQAHFRLGDDLQAIAQLFAEGRRLKAAQGALELAPLDRQASCPRDSPAQVERRPRPPAELHAALGPAGQLHRPADVVLGKVALDDRPFRTSSTMATESCPSTRTSIWRSPTRGTGAHRLVVERNLEHDAVAGAGIGSPRADRLRGALRPTATRPRRRRTPSP